MGRAGVQCGGQVRPHKLPQIRARKRMPVEREDSEGSPAGRQYRLRGLLRQVHHRGVRVSFDKSLPRTLF